MKLIENLKQKKLVKWAVVIIFILSVGYTAYSLGWKQVTNKYREQGFNTAVNYIISQINQNGRVKINNDIILVPIKNPDSMKTGSLFPPEEPKKEEPKK